MRLSTYGQFGGGFGQVAGDNRTDAIRKSKEKLEEEKKKGASQDKPQAQPKEEDPKLNKKGKPKKNKKKSPSTPDEIRAKNEDKQNKFDEKQALKKDIKAAKQEGKDQRDARKREKQGQKAADKEVKEQKDLATRSVTERPPAGYQDASNPDAAPTMINGRRMMRDEANMQYIDVDTGERFPFGPNETAAMKIIINRRVQRKQAGAINQETVGPDGKIRMDQYDAELLAKARKADMEAGHTNTRGASSEPADNGEAPQRWQQNGAMGPTPVGEEFPDSLDYMSTAQMNKVSDLKGRRVKWPDGQWYSIKNRQQAIDFLNGRGNQPTGDLTETQPEEKPGPDQQDVMPPVDDPMAEPPKLRTDGPFPYYERAPEGNEIGGTRFKDQEDFNKFQRDEDRRMRMRPGGGAQRERDAMDGGPLYSDKTPEEQWREREVYQQPTPTLTAEELETLKANGPTVEQRIQENTSRGWIDKDTAKEMKEMLEAGDEAGVAEMLSQQNRDRIAERRYGNSGGMFSVPSDQQPSRSEMLGESPNAKMGPDIEIGPSREARGLQMDDDNVVPMSNNVNEEQVERGMAADNPNVQVSDKGQREFDEAFPKGEDFQLTQENFDEIARLNGMGWFTDDYVQQMGYTTQQVAELQQQLIEKEIGRRDTRRVAASTLDNLFKYNSNGTQTVLDSDGNQLQLPAFLDPEGNPTVRFEEIVDSIAMQQREQGMEVDKDGIAEEEAAKILISTIPSNVPYGNLPTFYQEAVQSMVKAFMVKWQERMNGLADRRIENIPVTAPEEGKEVEEMPIIRFDDPEILKAVEENWREWTNFQNLPYSNQLQEILWKSLLGT